MAPRPEWRPDILGEHFEQLTLPLRPDAEGDVVATLVRYSPAPRLHLHRGSAADADVLYVHGWSDYFFQRRLARTFTERGARFFALDLRRYGRSLRPGRVYGVGFARPKSTDGVRHVTGSTTIFPS